MLLKKSNGHEQAAAGGKNGKEGKTEISAFTADLELAEYQYRVETGQLTEQEKADRDRILKFLGYGT